MRRFTLLVACFLPAFAAALEEVPFVPTPDNVTLAMLQVAKVGPSDYVIDLGSGDGRIVITAAKRFGARGLGVELSRQLVEESRAAAQAAGVSSRALFREQDLFATDLLPATVVTMYLLPEVNLALRPRLLKLRPGTRIVSHDWDMGDWQPDRTMVIDVPEKELGLEKNSKVHFWIVPAQLEGRWCGTGKAKGMTLDVAQQYQMVRARLEGPGGDRGLRGRVQGTTARMNDGVGLALDGSRLRASAPRGKFSDLNRATFAKAGGPSCE
jgi:SAM-dependent methyltransferase